MDNSRPILLLLILSAIMFLLRTVPIYQLIFTDWDNFVNFASDDAVYHMRLVHNTIHHFPWRIFFDPFTHFPFGNQIHFGPLFTLIIAGTSLVVGLGNPSPELVNFIGAFTPVIMGALCLIPLYFIARNLFGKISGLVASFILAFLPGEFLNRSALGFTDHHIAETLFSTTACAFLIYALNSSITRKQNRDLLTYGILCGISFGLFILIWPAALLFGAIFLIFLITQLIVDHLKNNQTGYLLLLSTTIYIIPAIMVLPYALMNPHLELTYYSLTQPIILTAMVGIFATCYLIHTACKLNRLTKDLYTPILLMAFVLAVFILQYYNPEFFSLITDGIKLLFKPITGMRNIVEAHPSILNESGTSFSVIPIWRNYYWITLFAITGFGYLSYRVYQKALPKETFLLIWSIIIMFSAFAQSRFNYYFAINMAILAGCYSIYPLLNFLNRSKQKIALYAVVSIFTILTISPIFILVINKSAPKPLPITHERYNTLIWLETNTPDPQGKTINKNFDYASGYYPIPKDPSTFYQYPKSAYGIMAWWNIGHQITYIAKRIPNTNPFQLGIIEKDRSMGAAPFFTSSDEKEAVQNLNKIGSRYVLITNRIAKHIEGIGSWNNDTKNWTKFIKTETGLKLPIDSEKFLQTMLNRLYYNDANGLKHFRLIHESSGDYLVTINCAILKPYIHTETTTKSFKNYDIARKNAAITNKNMVTDTSGNILEYYARSPTKNIKIFERVKGAIITGKAPKNAKNNTQATITLKLKTKFDRIIIYKQTSQVKDGKYRFIVPYPTTPTQEKNYSYDIKPMDDYQIRIGSETVKVSVPEKAIMLGRNIKINMVK